MSRMQGAYIAGSSVESGLNMVVIQTLRTFAACRVTCLPRRCRVSAAAGTLTGDPLAIRSFTITSLTFGHLIHASPKLHSQGTYCCIWTIDTQKYLITRQRGTYAAPTRQKL